MAIEVRVTRDFIDKAGNDIHVANYVMKEFREKGAPITGALFITGVTFGSVAVTEDHFGDLTFTWSEE